MLNPLREVNWRPDLRQRRKFAASLLVGFPVLAVPLLLTGRWQTGTWSPSIPAAVSGAGVALGLILWFVPSIARPVYVVWHAVAGCIGWMAGNTFLATVYLLMFAPLGWALRATRRKSLRAGLDRTAATYWRDAAPPPDSASYYRQF